MKEHKYAALAHRTILLVALAHTTSCHAEAPPVDIDSVAAHIVHQHQDLRDSVALEQILGMKLAFTGVMATPMTNMLPPSLKIPMQPVAFAAFSPGAVSPAFGSITYQLFTERSGKIADYGKPLVADLSFQKLPTRPCLPTTKLEALFKKQKPDFEAQDGKLMTSYVVPPQGEGSAFDLIAVYHTDAGTGCVDSLEFRQTGNATDLDSLPGDVVASVQDDPSLPTSGVAQTAASVEASYSLANALSLFRQHLDLRDVSFFQSHLSKAPPQFSPAGTPVADHLVADGITDVGAVPYRYRLVLQGSGTGWTKFAESDLPAVASITLHDIPAPICITRTALTSIFGTSPADPDDKTGVVRFDPPKSESFQASSSIGGWARFEPADATCARSVALYQVEVKPYSYYAPPQIAGETPTGLVPVSPQSTLTIQTFIHNLKDVWDGGDIRSPGRMETLFTIHFNDWWPRMLPLPGGRGEIAIDGESYAAGSDEPTIRSKIFTQGIDVAGASLPEPYHAQLTGQVAEMTVEAPKGACIRPADLPAFTDRQRTEDAKSLPDAGLAPDKEPVTGFSLSADVEKDANGCVSAVVFDQRLAAGQGKTP